MPLRRIIALSDGTLVSGSVRQNAILQTDVWDGRDDHGNFPPSGFYLVRAVASDVASVLSSGSTAQQTISYDPLRIYDLAVTPLRGDSGGAVISYQVSETMKVAIKIYNPGTAFDGSGNPSPPESVSLVRRIPGAGYTFTADNLRSSSDASPDTATGPSTAPEEDVQAEVDAATEEPETTV